MKRGAYLAVVIAILLATALCAAQDTIPLRRGSRWIYSGTVRWVDASNTPRKVSVKLKTEVSQYIARGQNAAALLLDFPTALNSYKPDSPAHSHHLLVRIGSAYYLIDVGAGELFATLKATAPEKWKDKISPDSIFFELPLKTGDKYCARAQRERTDGRYCWVVIGSRPLGPKSKLKAISREPAIRLTFLTAPDETTLRLVPGIGIVSYHFAHHGTVAEVNVKLTEYHLP